MRIRRFTAEDMTAALKLVRQTLGREAVILEAKGIREGRGSRKGVEVLAAVDRHLETRPTGVPGFTETVASDEPAPTEPYAAQRAETATPGVSRTVTAEPPTHSAPRLVHQPGAAPSPLDRLVEIAGSGARTLSARPSNAPRAAAPPPERTAGVAAPPPRMPQVRAVAPAPQAQTAPAPEQRRPPRQEQTGLESEVHRLSSRVTYLNRMITSDHFSAIPIPLRELYLNLIEAEVDSNLTFALLRDIAAENPPDLVSPPKLAPLKRRLLPIVPRGASIATAPGRRVAILAGPPGTGKTSVAAALAAQAIRAGRYPGLISLDTFRAGGPAVLEHYARVLEVPFAAVYAAEDLMEAAHAGLGDCDLVIVDTPGMMPEEAEPRDLVREFAASVVDPETHLVLSATSKVRDAAGMLRYFAQFDPHSIVFTKLDATDSYGGILSLSLKARLPVSHVNWGRRVLEDLRDCTPEALLALVFDRCAVTSWGEPADERPGGRPRVMEEAQR